MKLRRTLLAARSQVSERSAAATAVATNLWTALAHIPDCGNKTIAGYVPMGDELDCRLALAIAVPPGAQICLPVVGPRGKRLKFRRWQAGESLVAGPLGTAHPPPAAPVVDPDILLVPLVAFDRHGNRLGRGGGYYDRTLAALRAKRPVLAIGLAFDFQEVPEVPTEPDDQPLDMVITERRTLSFSPQPD
ncbi:MAG: 5-formyltetrahydrofolate cyclo-ligase [Rhodospirillaceae bacterium]|nr:MAG: 5-formyltetrahydrofolate cyclo-ligase [Rhodospirillaceae bacterium]